VLEVFINLLHEAVQQHRHVLSFVYDQQIVSERCVVILRRAYALKSDVVETALLVEVVVPERVKRVNVDVRSTVQALQRFFAQTFVVGQQEDFSRRMDSSDL